MAAFFQVLSILAAIFISVTAATASPQTSSFPQFYHLHSHVHALPPPFLADVLSSVGFQELSSAASNLSLQTLIPSPATIFAPSDSSLLSCPSCSLPLLLLEHSVPGKYTFQFVSALPFATKLETLAHERCLTITTATSAANSTANETTVFVGGAQITHPDLFHNAQLVVHGLHGFISHLSPISCHVEQFSSLSFPQVPLTSPFSTMHLMLKDAFIRLRISGHSVLALALRTKYEELVDFHELTVFALRDDAIFLAGHSYISNLNLHIVPNRRLIADELMRLPVGTYFPTLDRGQSVIVTTAGGGGPLLPMRINYIKINRFDVVYNAKVVVHELSTPLLHVHPPTLSNDEGSGENEGPVFDFTVNSGLCKVLAPSPAVGQPIGSET